MKEHLAIIIPAYRGRFLSRALESIAAQTDKRFRVYVGDDASSDSLEAIVAGVGLDKDRLIYHRFESNLGGTSLVKQWERCIDLSNEPWVWLFSDDDVMEPECVAKFHATLDLNPDRFDLYRFNTVVIDADDQVVSINPKHPEQESWSEFAYFLLRSLRIANQQELIFRRSEYEKIGGFLNLPLAWGSDHVFAIACGMRAGIWTINGPGIKFRQSGDNFSSHRSDETDRQKWRANAGYVEWLLGQIRTAEFNGFPDRDTLELMVLQSYYGSIRSLRKWIGMEDAREMLTFMSKHLGDSRKAGIARLAMYNATAVGESLKVKVRDCFR